MELLLFVFALIAIGVLAAAFGDDSQHDVVASKEHALALMGMTWEGSPRPDRRQAQSRARTYPPMTAQPQRPPAPPRTVVARTAMASALYRAADWLAPNPSDVRAA